uniref:Uncharacterized protein n=1 Tax=Sarcoptes scabiei TaxID=52283 RepID=A0A834RII3_SARSC
MILLVLILGKTMWNTLSDEFDNDHFSGSSATTSTSNQCSNEFQFEANHLSDQVQSSLLRTNRSNYRSRLQYTCMDICAIERMDYLALGTNTGSVYVYTRIDSIWIHYCTIIAEELVGFISFLHFFNMKILSYDDEDCDETNTFSSMPSTIISPLNNRSQSKNFDRRESHFDLFLSIGTMKGHLIIVQLNLCQTLRSESAKTSFSKTSQCCETAEHFSDSKESRTNLDEIRSSTYRTVFRSCSFTNDLINLIYFDGFNRLFIADQTGKLFVFGDLRTTLSKWPIDYQNSSNLFVDASLLINLNGVSIFQFDACEDFLVFSTTQSKVYLFDFANKKCFPLGKKSTKQLSTNNRNRYLFLSGVCIEAKSTGARTLQSDTQRQDESIYPIMNGVWNRKFLSPDQNVEFGR